MPYIETRLHKTKKGAQTSEAKAHGQIPRCGSGCFAAVVAHRRMRSRSASGDTAGQISGSTDDCRRSGSTDGGT